MSKIKGLEVSLFILGELNKRVDRYRLLIIRRIRVHGDKAGRIERFEAQSLGIRHIAKHFFGLLRIVMLLALTTIAARSVDVMAVEVVTVTMLIWPPRKSSWNLMCCDPMGNRC